MRIGIYSPNWIGDSVIALTFVQSIRAFESDAEIFIVCKEWVAGVYQEHPAIDGVLSFSSAQLSGLANIYKMGTHVISRGQDARARDDLPHIVSCSRDG